MASTPPIPTPREHIGEVEIGSDGKPTGNIVPTRSWWRFWNGVGSGSGSLEKPVTIAPNSIVTPGVINSGSTVTLMDSPPLTVLGNSSNVAAAPTPQAVDASLSFNSGTIAIRSIPAGTLSGNPGNTAAPPTFVQVGANLSLAGGVLSGVPSTDDLALVKTIAYWQM